MLYGKVLYKMLISLYLMTRQLKSLGMVASIIAAAVLVMGISAITPDVLAQNTTEGLGVPLNATGAQSSPEAMNNTLTPTGPENETVIAN